MKTFHYLVEEAKGDGILYDLDKCILSKIISDNLNYILSYNSHGTIIFLY